MTEDNTDPEEQDASFATKVILTLFPFAVVLIFLLVELWIRGRS